MAYAPAGINRRCNDCGVRHGAPNPCGRDDDDDESQSEVLDALRDRRRELGLSQGEVSSRMGAPSPASVWEWENGHESPTLNQVEAWAGALGMTVEVVDAGLDGSDL